VIPEAYILHIKTQLSVIFLLINGFRTDSSKHFIFFKQTYKRVVHNFFHLIFLNLYCVVFFGPERSHNHKVVKFLSFLF